MTADIVGAADGSDVDAIIEAISGVGAVSPAMRPMAAAMGQVKQQLKAKDLPIGFAGITPTSVAAAGTANLAVPLTVNMRLDRVVMGQAACVATSRITQISIGSINLLVGTQAIPCEVFKFDAVATSIKAAVVATPAVSPTVSVSNGTAGAIVYEGAVIGPVFRD